MIFKQLKQGIDDVFAIGNSLTQINNLKLDATNITGYATALKGLTVKQAELVLSTKGLTVAQQQAVLAEAELLGVTGRLTTAELNAILVNKKRNKDQAEALLIKTGLITAETSEATATNVVTAAKLKELVQTKALTQAEADLIAAKAGVTLANQKESASFLAGVGSKIKGLGSGLKSAGTGVLALAKAHPVIAAITTALTIGTVAVGIYKKKQEEAAEAIREAYKNAKTAIEEVNSTFKNTESTTKQIAEEYAELAQGVNLLSNENKKLSTEKYERFLELSNQLSTLYPSLTKNYDENGNAILDLSGDVDTIVGSLDDLIERQRALANQEIVEQMPDLFAGYTNNVAYFKEQLDEAEKAKDAVQSAYDTISKYGIYTAFDINGNAKDANGDPVALKLGQYISLLETLGITAKQVNLKDSMGQIIGYKLELEDGSDIPNISGIHDAYVSQFNKTIDDVKYAKMQLDSETSSINQYLNTWLQTEFSYNQLESDGLQKAIQETLFNFDWSSLPAGIDKNDWEAVSEYLRRNVLFSINNIDDTDVSQALADIYTGALTSGELLNAISKVQEYFGEEHPISVALEPKVNDVQPLVNSVKDLLKGTEFDDKVGELSLGDLKIASELEVPLDSIESWEELLALIEKVKSETFNHETTISFNYENLDNIESKLSSIQSAYDTITTAMQEYNEQGFLNMSTIDSLIALDDEYINALIDENGNLQYNAQTFQKLAEIKLEEAKVSVYQQACEELVRIKTLDTALAAQELALSNGTLTESAYETAKALYEEVVAMGGANAVLAQNTWDVAQKKVALLDNQLKNVSNSTYNFAKASSSSSSSAKSEFSELVDFFERRVKVLNDALDLLDTNLENVTGSFAKNKLLDAQFSINEEKVRNYTDALAMYTECANYALSKLPADIAEKVKNGAVDVTQFVGAENEVIVNTIEEYEKWADKANECESVLAELAQTLETLELNKFQNVVEDFTNQFDILEDSISLMDKQISLIEESGELVGSAFYSSEIAQSEKQLELLEQEKAKLVEQMNSALSSGRVKVGSEAWLSMIDSLSDVESNILDVKTNIEELDTAIQDLHWENVDRIADRFSDISEEIDNLIGLVDDVDVADKSGNWSKEGLVQLGLYAQEYERATYASQMYAEEIEKLNQAYTNGEYTLLEYQEKLASLTEQQWSEINASEEALDSIKQLNEARVDIAIEGINEEIEKFEELTNAQIEALDSRKELEDYKKSISEKTTDIEKLQREISAMELDSSASTTALRLRKQEELQEALDELEQMQRDHSIDEQKKGLEQQLDDYQSTREAEIEALEESLNNQEKLISDSFNVVKQNASTVGQQIAQIATKHGVTVSNSLISAWNQGENAIASYGEVLSPATSAFIGNVMGVENEVWALQAQANNTANTLAYMFSTQADNLVNELTQSYYAEGNLANMTNALQQSLVNTLERGYNVSGITSALESIKNSTNNVTNSLASLSKELNNFDKRTVTTGVVSHGGSGNIISLNKNTLAHYDSGTRSSKGNLIITDEEGYELKLPKLTNGNYTIENEGTQILTKAQTDNIFDWSKINPSVVLPDFLTPAVNLPKFEPRNVNNAPSLHLDKLIHIDKVDNSNIKQMESIANKAVNNLVDKLYNGKKYGSY